MAGGLAQLGQLLQLKNQMDSSKMAGLKHQQGLQAIEYQKQKDAKRYNLDTLIQQRLQGDRDLKAQTSKEEKEYSSVANTNLPNLLESYAGNRAGFMQEAGLLASEYPGAPKTALKDASAMFDSAYGKEGAGSDMLPSLVRAYGSEAPFIMQTYGKGDVPENAADFEVLTREAAADPDYGKKRTQWANSHVANTMKNLGMSAEDPSKTVYEDRFGVQHEAVNKGDTISQQLKTPTTEETTKLSEYRNTYNEIEDIGRAMNDLFIGPYEGNWNTLKSKFADTPEFQKFKTKAAQLRTIIYGLSGKQINETEQKWLDGILPKVYQPDENFQSNLDTLKEWIEDRQQAFLIELKNSRRYTATQPLGGGDKGGWDLKQVTAEQEDEAFEALGVDATDEALDEWLINKFGGK